MKGQQLLASLLGFIFLFATGFFTVAFGNFLILLSNLDIQRNYIVTATPTSAEYLNSAAFSAILESTYQGVPIKKILYYASYQNTAIPSIDGKTISATEALESVMSSQISQSYLLVLTRGENVLNLGSIYSESQSRVKVSKFSVKLFLIDEMIDMDMYFGENA